MDETELNAQRIELRIQALADNELPEEEIPEVLEAIQGSYEYRKQYAEVLALKRRLAGLVVRDPGPDWVAAAEKRVARKLFRGTGTVFIIGSYLALLAVGLVSLFRDPDVPLYVSVLVGVGALGLFVLLGNAIADRVRERKTDKYRGILR
jgi:hypothetical protein